MKHLLRFRWQIRCAVCAVNVLHLLVHGTALDSGALDGALMQLDLMWIASS